MAAIDVIIIWKTKYKYLINIATELLYQNLHLCIYLDIIEQIQ